MWDERIGSPRVQAKNWRLMAFGCLTLALMMAGGLVWRSAQSIVTPYVVEVDNAGQVRAVGEAATPYRPNDAQTAHHIARFVTLVRSLSIDPIVVRQNWLDAYDYTTDKGAAVLNDPFARIGNRRTLAILVGGLSVAVLGATIWSLQPQRRGTGEQTELYNVDRVSKSEGLDALPTDYSKLPPALPPDVPELGPPLPGDLGLAIVASQQPVTPGYSPPGHDPEDALRKEADAAAASSVFFRSGGQSHASAAQGRETQKHLALSDRSAVKLVECVLLHIEFLSGRFQGCSTVTSSTVSRWACTRWGSAAGSITKLPATSRHVRDGVATSASPDRHWTVISPGTWCSGSACPAASTTRINCRCGVLSRLLLTTVPRASSVACRSMTSRGWACLRAMALCV